MKNEKIIIEDVFCPDNGILKKDIDEDGNDTGWVMNIVDGDLDTFKCHLIGDGYITINAENYNYIMLDLGHLSQLKNAIKIADILNKE